MEPQKIEISITQLVMLRLLNSVAKIVDGFVIGAGIALSLKVIGIQNEI